MIRESEVFKIGTLTKPSGVDGAMRLVWTDDVFDRSDSDCLVCLLDGIFVPFFIETYEMRHDNTAIVKLEGIDSQEKASEFTPVDVYFLKMEVDDAECVEGLSWNFFKGFEIHDIKRGNLGVIEDIDDRTANVLFVLTDGIDDILIPANEEFIIDVDADEGILMVELPDGLI